MKIKGKGFMPFRLLTGRGKKVYYFNHGHGVLERRAANKLQMAASMMSMVVVIAGIGVGGMKLADLYAKHQQNKPLASQRQTGPIDTQEESDEASNKLKDATTKAREDEQLAKQVKNKLKNVPGGQKWSVYIRDVKSDRMASVNADTSFEAGSLANLFLTLPLEAKTPSANWNSRAGKQTIAQCLEALINGKDPSCNSSLNGYANIKEADSVLESHSFKKTTIEDAKKQATTPRDVGEFLYQIQKGQLISDKARRIVFDGLYAHTQREGLPKVCEQQTDCLVANIAHENKSLRHDAAVVTIGQHQYVVVIMTNNDASWSQMADVSKAVYETLQP